MLTIPESKKNLNVFDRALIRKYDLKEYAEKSAKQKFNAIMQRKARRGKFITESGDILRPYSFNKKSPEQLAREFKQAALGQAREQKPIDNRAEFLKLKYSEQSRPSRFSDMYKVPKSGPLNAFDVNKNAYREAADRRAKYLYEKLMQRKSRRMRGLFESGQPVAQKQKYSREQALFARAAEQTQTRPRRINQFKLFSPTVEKRTANPGRTSDLPGKAAPGQQLLLLQKTQTIKRLRTRTAQRGRIRLKGGLAEVKTRNYASGQYGTFYPPATRQQNYGIASKQQAYNRLGNDERADSLRDIFGRKKKKKTSYLPPFVEEGRTSQIFDAEYSIKTRRANMFDLNGRTSIREVTGQRNIPGRELALANSARNLPGLKPRQSQGLFNEQRPQLERITRQEQYQRQRQEIRQAQKISIATGTTQLQRPASKAQQRQMRKAMQQYQRQQARTEQTTQSRTAARQSYFDVQTPNFQAFTLLRKRRQEIHSTRASKWQKQTFRKHPYLKLRLVSVRRRR